MKITTVQEILRVLVAEYGFIRVENALSYMGCGPSHELDSLWSYKVQLTTPIALAVLSVVSDGLAKGKGVPSYVIEKHLPAIAAKAATQFEVPVV